jgi:hypothetical protein
MMELRLRVKGGSRYTNPVVILSDYEHKPIGQEGKGTVTISRMIIHFLISQKIRPFLPDSLIPENRFVGNISFISGNILGFSDPSCQ